MTHPEVVIVSDLHLCDGGRREDFQPDDESALVSLVDELAKHTPLELVINGDFIDFVQIQPRPEMWFGDRFDASEHESVEKLECALSAHGPVFDALRRFTRAGGLVRFNYGNHDIDLAWPEVQRRLHQRISGTDGDTHALQFGWVYSTAGVYIEHGHQADPANSFADMRALIHRDAIGTPRLERCWGTRLVEEFYNQIEEIDGLHMLDNVRPRLRAAAIIVSHGLRHPAMYPVLRSGLTLVLQALATMRNDEDVHHASEHLGVPATALRLLAASAGFLGLRPPAAGDSSPGWSKMALEQTAGVAFTATAATGARPQSLAIGSGASVDAPATNRLLAPTLHQAFRMGRSLSGDPLGLQRELESAGVSFPGHSFGDWSPTPHGPGGQPSTGAEIYQGDASRRYLHRAQRIAAARPGLSAICFGHTHVPTDERLQVDQQDGWPLEQTSCRYYNSGAWTRSLNLHEPRWSEASWEDLCDPASYRQGRDLIHIRWPADDSPPEVAMHRWDAHARRTEGRK